MSSRRVHGEDPPRFGGGGRGGRRARAAGPSGAPKTRLHEIPHNYEHQFFDSGGGTGYAHAVQARQGAASRRRPGAGGTRSPGARPGTAAPSALSPYAGIKPRRSKPRSASTDRFRPAGAAEGHGPRAACCRDRVQPNSGLLMVLYGDTPLLSAATLQRLRDNHRQSGAAATLITTDARRSRRLRPRDRG